MHEFNFPLLLFFRVKWNTCIRFDGPGEFVQIILYIIQIVATTIYFGQQEGFIIIQIIKGK